MDISPTTEFREACRRILGDDSPGTIITAIQNDDPRWRQVRELHAQLQALAENADAPDPAAYPPINVPDLIAIIYVAQHMIIEPKATADDIQNWVEVAIDKRGSSLSPYELEHAARALWEFGRLVNGELPRIKTITPLTEEAAR